MDSFSPDLSEEKTRLQNKLFKEKNINKIAGGKIDRDIHVDLNELTLSELDFEMSKRAASIKRRLDPRVYFAEKKINSKLIKVILLLPFSFRLLFKNLFLIIRDFMFFNNTLIIRQRKGEEEMSKMRETISELTDNSNDIKTAKEE